MKSSQNKPLLSLKEKGLLTKVQDRVKKILENESSGHDYWHAYRVMKMNQYLAKGHKVDIMSLLLAGLLHDIGYPEIKNLKDYSKNHIISADKAEKILREFGLTIKTIKKVKSIIRETEHVDSSKREVISIEAQIQQDSDRLDAIGAIGIGRAFMFAGKYNILIHDPKISPYPSFSADRVSRTIINHFYEKLLRLGNGYNTKEANRIAKKRVSFMKKFLERFFKEWEGLE